ncbi:hypothetical protein BFV94_3652 [Alteromonas macleodii]|uniref:Uncharacterized protein n=1 Tax=Alteromonas macleodii TaxID=28108 RepID=A0AB36FQ12_ALTMA|nr:hypothetical protein BFV95_3656 [Alteromonas macleodii]OES27462.1 hypothetical protein BFV94_3652 [Alteromonas macleodii]OES27763.1 hypothetical protein BFV93_3646 [Alteromonas macleodii]OES39720.1 hypothetical protein BFV96_3641 [Alteromonas macleodii]
MQNIEFRCTLASYKEKTNNIELEYTQSSKPQKNGIVARFDDSFHRTF